MRQSVPAAGAPKSGPEKRRWRRYPVDIRVRATVRFEGVLKIVHGRGTDLGQGGMAASLPIKLDVGDVIELDFDLPGSTEDFRFRAIIRNRESFTYGVEFTNITLAQQGEIERACQALTPVQ